MVSTLKYFCWSVSILLCYPLYAAGQLYLFISKQKESDFYTLLNKYPGEWITAHVLLIAGLILLIPAFTGLCAYFRNTRSYPFVQLSMFFTVLSIFPLVGQFAIDLTLVEIFKLPRDIAYQTLDRIQNNSVIDPLFYNNSKLFFALKYADLALIGQLLLCVALLLSNKVPVWAKTLFIVALLLTQLAILIHPFWGRIIKRGSYALLSVSLMPVTMGLLKKTPNREPVAAVQK